MSDIKFEKNSNFVILRREKSVTYGYENTTERLFYRWDEYRCGLFERRGTRPFLSGKVLRSARDFIVCNFLRNVFSVSVSGTEIRRVRTCGKGIVSARRARCQMGGIFALVHSVCGNVGRFRRAAPEVEAVALDSGTFRRCVFRPARNEGDHDIQFRARTRAPRIRVLFGRKNPDGFARVFRNGAPVCGWDRVCGNERLSRCASSDGCGEGHEKNFTARVTVRRRRCGLRRRYSRKNLRRGCGSDTGGNAFSVRNAERKIIFGHGGCGNLDFAGILAVSATDGVRRVDGRKKVRRRERRAPCGVFAFPRRTYRNRKLFLSFARGRRTTAFSCLHS